MTVEPSDEALAARVAVGDRDAFGCLYDRYARPVYALASHLLGVEAAEEVVQEVFLRLWRHAGQYDPARGAFSPWFMAVARHQVRAELRRRGVRARLDAAGDIERLLAETPSPDIDLGEAVWLTERAAAVRQALADLPPEQRKVLLLTYFGDLSQGAIAQSLGWPLGTVKKRLRLGMQKLRVRLAGTAVSPAPMPDVSEAAVFAVGQRAERDR